jgi:hypothetical protein
MSVKKFKFVSPGVFIDEIDNSQLPDESEAIGPVIIGRAPKGPSMRPTKVNSFSEFVDVFGTPMPGGQGTDVWREGNETTPMYGMYAAQAWLRNAAPLTYVRLLGEQHSKASAYSGYGGWETWLNGTVGTSAEIGAGAEDTKGGAYGLFIAPQTGSAMTTGSLAAVVYLTEGSFNLSGTIPGQTANRISGSACLIYNKAASKTFTAVIKDRNDNLVKKTDFNFDKNSDKYIRKVLNTNPILTSDQGRNRENRETYWLGETYDRAVADLAGSNAANEYYGLVLGLGYDTSAWQHHREGAQRAETGWVISQDLRVTDNAAPAGGFDPANHPNHTSKLFRFLAMDSGEWAQNNLKISIQDIKTATDTYDPYGSFTVLVRKIDDNDGAVKVLERFSGCNLNPNSVNYIARKVGDRYTTWDEGTKRYIEYGNYENRSKYIYVDPASDVDLGTADPLLLPYGFYGPTKPKSFSITNTSTTSANVASGSTPANFVEAYVKGGTAIAGSACLKDTLAGMPDVPSNNLTDFVLMNHINESGIGGATNQIASQIAFEFPTFVLRSGSVDNNLGSPQDAYFGFDSRQTTTGVTFERSNGDIARRLPTDIAAASTETAFIFTLDDLRATSDGMVHYESGSRAAGTSVTAVSGTYKDIISSGHDRFTLPLHSGFDGINITERNPFNNTIMEDKTETTSSPFFSVKKAIDTVSDSEVVEINLASVPGLWHEGLSAHLVNVCEDRGDSLAVIDLKGGYEPKWEGGTETHGSHTTTIDNLKNRAMNSSYACAYYPWVHIRDTINGSLLWVPPSVASIGTFASSQAKSALWFAPAGFTRGGLTEGSAGVPVVGVRERLTSKMRDELYDANINPIATFPAEGVVIFGQKTLQVTRSALDRINVRRLMIFIKKEISRIAATTLFEQNVPATWANFTSRAIPFLRDIKVGLGLTDFKVVLDESTTTDDLVDRNIMYAKIFLKPARAIEFIALDFVVSRSGASFED